jgi:hypothetical protein
LMKAKVSSPTRALLAYLPKSQDRHIGLVSFLLVTLVVLALASGHVGAQDASRENRTVTLEYIAHACFRVTSPAGTQVLIDPYASRVWLGYDFPPNIHADAVLISHPHYDHSWPAAARRQPDRRCQGNRICREARGPMGQGIRPKQHRLVNTGRGPSHRSSWR